MRRDSPRAPSKRAVTCGADEGDCFVGHGAGGGLAGADGPDGLVGDGEAGRKVDAGEGAAGLADEDFVGLAFFALALGLADAEDGAQAGGKGGLQLLVHRLVGLAEVGAALGVADDDELDEALEHGRADFAGVGALRLPVQVLRADLDGAALQRVGDEGEEGERRAGDLLDAFDRVDEVAGGARRGRGRFRRWCSSSSCRR